MGGESEAAWRVVLDDPIARGQRTPEFLIVDGAGLQEARAALRPVVPTQRCTVRKHRNLREALDEELPGDHTDMIDAATVPEIEQRRRAFRARDCRNAVPDGVQEAGEPAVRRPPLAAEPMRSSLTADAVERLLEVCSVGS